MNLREDIQTLFPLADAPSYRLSDAIIEDDYGDTSYAFEESWSTWAEIENWQLAKSDVYFSYAPQDAALYVLPRFMLFVLDDIDGKLESKNQDTCATDSAVWYIQRLKKNGYESTNFTSVQIEVIEQFLAYIYKNLNYKATIDVGEKP